MAPSSTTTIDGAPGRRSDGTTTGAVDGRLRLRRNACRRRAGIMNRISTTTPPAIDHHTQAGVGVSRLLPSVGHSGQTSLLRGSMSSPGPPPGPSDGSVVGLAEGSTSGALVLGAQVEVTDPATDALGVASKGTQPKPSK